MREKMKIPLFKTHASHHDVMAVESVIDSGQDWACGSVIETFEKKIARFAGTKYAVVFNSGTSALHAMMIAFELIRGEIIVPSFTFIATANAALFTHMNPVLADIERDTFGLDVKDVEKRITKRTRAIMPIHYGGCPCRDYLELSDLAHDHGLLFFEDAAQSMGAKYFKTKIGSLGDASMFSFCQDKIISTGEGGVIVTNDDIAYQRLLMVRNHGRNSVGEYMMRGYNWRMPSMNAALGLSQMNSIKENIRRRKAIAKKYDKHLIGFPMKKKGMDSVYQKYAVKVNGRNRVMTRMQKKGVSTRAYFDTPVHMTPLYQDCYGYKKGMFPVTEEMSECVLNLPIYPDLTDEEIDYVIKSLQESIEQ